jgi:hypothetical protein
MPSGERGVKLFSRASGAGKEIRQSVRPDEYRNIFAIFDEA